MIFPDVTPLTQQRVIDDLYKLLVCHPGSPVATAVCSQNILREIKVLKYLSEDGYAIREKEFLDAF